MEEKKEKKTLSLVRNTLMTNTKDDDESNFSRCIGKTTPYLDRAFDRKAKNPVWIFVQSTSFQIPLPRPGRPSPVVGRILIEIATDCATFYKDCRSALTRTEPISYRQLSILSSRECRCDMAPIKKTDP